MPRNIDPGTVTVGKGRAPQGTVEDNSLRSPNRDVQPLRAHIEDPSRAHFAVAIAIEDVANNFTSDNVEGALAELATGISERVTRETFTSTRVNGVLTGGTYTTAALTLTMGGSSTVLMNGSTLDISGDSVILADNATNYVYVDSGTEVLTASTTPPALTTKPALLAQVVTAGGVATSERDLRFFVASLDRKPALTVRSDGPAGDSTAEGVFQTLEAAMIYLTVYGSSGSGDEVETHRILVRGQHSITSTILVPVDGTIIEGDGDANFVDATGGSVMFNLGPNRSNVQFLNCTFTANNSATVAIQGADPKGLTIERCTFQGGGGEFLRVINLTNSIVSGTQRLRVKDCSIAGDSGIFIGRGADNRILDTRFLGTGGPTGSGTALELSTATFANGGHTQVRGCRIEGYRTGISSFEEYLTVSDTAIAEVRFGLDLDGTNYATFRNIDLTVDATDGVSGIDIGDADGVRVLDSRIICPRTVWVGDPGPFGVRFTGSTMTDGEISNTVIDGFYDDDVNQGAGIQFTAGVLNLRISETTIRTARWGILGLSAAGLGNVWSGLSIQNVEVGIETLAPSVLIADSLVDLDATRGIVGILIGSVGHNTKVRNCIVNNNRDPATYAAATPLGIAVLGSDHVSVDNCHVSGFRSTTSVSYGIFFQSGSSYGSVTGGFINSSITSAINFDSGTTFCTATGVRIEGCGGGIRMGGADSVVEGCVFDLDDDVHSIFGVSVSGNRNKVIGCNMTLTRSTWSGETPFGIGFASGTNGCSAVGNTITNFLNATDNLGNGIFLLSSTTGAVVSGNRVSGSRTGVQIDNSCTSCVVSNNTLAGDEVETQYGIRVLGSAGVLRKLKLIGNDIAVFTVAGIFVEGLVQGVMVEGNSVDGFLSADPYNPTGQGILIETGGFGSPLDIQVNDNNVWRCANGISAEGTVTDYIRRLDILDNNVRYCGYAQNISAGVPDTYVGLGSKGIGAAFTSGLKVSGNTIEQIGVIIDNSNVEGFPDQGGPVNDVQGNGVVVRNCDFPQIHGNKIRDLRGNGSDGSGSTNVIGVRFDLRSTGLVTSATTEELQILDNSITWGTGLTGNSMLYGIQVQVARGTDAVAMSLQNWQVSRNIVRNIRSAGVAFLLGDAGNLTIGSVTENQIQGTTAPGARGILFDAPAVGAAVGGIQRLTVEGNQVRGPSTGLLFDIARNTSLYYLQVLDNGFYETQERAVDFSLTGALVGADITIRGNQFNDYETNGIRVIAGASVLRVPRLSILGNHFNTFDCANAHIRVAANESDFYGLVISDNQLLGEAGSGIGGSAPGIFISANGGSAPRSNIDFLDVSRNKIHLLEGECIRLEPVNGEIHNAQVVDNDLYNEGTGQVIRFNITLPSPVGDEVHRDINIDRNIVRGGGGVFFSSFNAKMFNFSFSDNQISDSGADGFVLSVQEANSGADDGLRNVKINGNHLANIPGQGIDLRLGNSNVSSQNDPCVGLQIANNSFHQCSTNASISCLRVRFWGRDQNVHITGNNFFGCCGSTDSDSIGVIIYRVGEVSENCAIVGNRMTDCGATGIIYADFAGSSFWQSYNLRICENQIFNQVNSGILVDLTVFGLHRNTLISGNIVEDTNSTTNSSSGVRVLGPTTNAVNGLQITNNILRGVEAFNPLTGGGISVIVPDDLLDSKIDGNSIHDSDGFGIYVSADGLYVGGSVNNNTVVDTVEDGIRVRATGVDAASDLEAVSVSGNNVSDSADIGIHIQALDSTSSARILGCSINGNTVTNTVSDGISVDPQGGVNTVQGLSIVGNAINNTGASGITIPFSGSGDLISIAVDSNTIYDVGASGILIGSLAAGNDIFSLSVSNNNITFIEDDGIFIGGTIIGIPNSSINGLAVNGNTIRDFSRDAGATNHGGIYVVAAAFQNVTVANNAIRSGQADAISYWFRPVGVLRTVAFTGNTSHNEGAANTESMRWDSAAGSDQVSMSFTGNTFRASTGGISINGSSFSPTDSAVVGNCSSSIGVPAQQWGNGGTGFTSNFTISATANNQG